MMHRRWRSRWKPRILENADAEQFKAILAAEIIKALDRDGLRVEVKPRVRRAEPVEQGCTGVESGVGTFRRVRAEGERFSERIEAGTSMVPEVFDFAGIRTQPSCLFSKSACPFKTAVELTRLRRSSCSRVAASCEYLAE